MNPLAEMWARRELERLDRIELRRICRELRESNKKLEPLRKEAAARRAERMRQDGPQGFRMVV